MVGSLYLCNNCNIHAKNHLDAAIFIIEMLALQITCLDIFEKEGEEEVF